MAKSSVSKLPLFVVQARFTEEITALRMRFLDQDGVVYLDEKGNWSSLASAARHRSREDAEAALEAAWATWRVSGSRNVILSVRRIDDGNTDKLYQHGSVQPGSGDNHW